MIFLYVLYVLACAPCVVCFALASILEANKRTKFISVTICVLLLIGLFFGGMFVYGR